MSDQLPEAPKDSTPEQIENALAAARLAAPGFAALRPAERAELLRGVADALDADAAELVALAMAESHLPEGRLAGELKRTTFQLRLFATELDDGAYLEATVDHADPGWGMGPRPDLRRMLVPLGPAVVFAASNFPFAFSVAGGDTASALAAGCPVIVKAHPGHPRLSRRTGEIVAGALPAGVFGVVYGFEAGPAVLRDPRIKVGAFTGSLGAGRALFDIASSRPEPIPFYGELGSVNPVFVTPSAAGERAEEIAEGYVGSFTLGVGQFCTKPGLLFVPEGRDGEALRDAIVDRARKVGAAPMLDAKIRDGFRAGLDALADAPGVDVLVDGSTGPEGAPSLLATTLETVRRDPERLLAECFGPVSIIITYAGPDGLRSSADLVEGTLTATVQGTPADVEGSGGAGGAGRPGGSGVRELLDALAERAGRVLWNGWPTGVSVTYAMQHGGPWPATVGSTHTSVGTSATRRFLRPVAYQDLPQPLLPEALRDDNPLGIPRRVDGSYVTGRTEAR